MDGFMRHQLEGVSVDIQVVPAQPSGYAARRYGGLPSRRRVPARPR